MFKGRQQLSLRVWVKDSQTTLNKKWKECSHFSLSLKRVKEMKKELNVCATGEGTEA